MILKFINTRHYILFRLIIVIVSVLLFIVSLMHMAFTYSVYDMIDSYSSLRMFLFGGFVFLVGGFWEWIVWLANPLYIYSIILLLKNNSNSLKVSLIALLLSISFVFWDEILISEKGAAVKILHLELCYFLWIASIIIMTFGTVLQFCRKEEKEIKQRTPNISFDR